MSDLSQSNSRQSAWETEDLTPAVNALIVRALLPTSETWRLEALATGFERSAPNYTPAGLAAAMIREHLRERRLQEEACDAA